MARTLLSSKKGIRIGNLLLIISSVIITMVIMEAFSILCVYFQNNQLLNHKKQIMTFKEWQTKNLPLFPYKGVNWYNREFLAEQNKCHQWFVPEGKNYAVNLDFSGKFINYVHGRRVTTDQPEKFKHVVYLLGGSTVACEQVPDRYTIASYLQRLMNSNYPGEYKVVNYARGLSCSDPTKGWIRRVVSANGRYRHFLRWIQ